MLTRGEKVRLRDQPDGPLLVVVGQYLDGEQPGVVLQTWDGKTAKGPRFSRLESDVVLAFPKVEGKGG